MGRNSRRSLRAKCARTFFFRAEAGIRALYVAWSSDVCSSDLCARRRSPRWTMCSAGIDAERTSGYLAMCARSEERRVGRDATRRAMRYDTHTNLHQQLASALQGLKKSALEPPLAGIAGSIEPL